MTKRTTIVGTVASFVLAAILASSAPLTRAATINVASVAQLEAALAAAADGDTIVLAPGFYGLTHTLFVDANVTIQGDPATQTVIDGNGSNILSVNGNNVSLLNLTLQNGGTAISYGGSGVFSVTGVTITLSENGFDAGDSSGVTQFTNSTIANNSGRGFQVACAEVHLKNVTVSNNAAGLYFDFPCGETMQVVNSLVVENTKDCDGGGSFKLLGDHSIDRDGSCVALALASGGGGFTTSNPNLGALTVNGGPTRTEAIAATSTARDTGNNAVCPTTDQRGFQRADGACDVGAFEFGASSGGPGNTQPGANVTVSPSPGVTVTFSSVTGAGNTTATTTSVQPPAGFVVDGVAYDVATTAAFTGMVTVCLPYSPAIDPTPRIFHFQGGAFVDVTTSVDTQTRVVCGSVTSLSPFAVLVAPSVLTELQQLQLLINSFNLKKPVAKKFVHRLDEARKALAKAKHDPTKKFCKAMDDFIKAVQKEAGKSLTAAEASQLVTAASGIEVQIGCK